MAKEIRSREQLSELLEMCERLVKAGRDVPWKSVEEAQREYFAWVLRERVCRGDGVDQDVVDLVCWHWPHLARQQRLALDYWQAGYIRQILEGRHTDLKEVYIKGATGVGKGGATALAVNLWFESADECKVIITSDTASHAEKVMFGEVARFRKVMQYCCQASIGVTSIKVNEAKYIQVANPESVESFSGQHGPATLFIFDEASGCDEMMWNQAETQGAMCVALSNPRPNATWFKRGFPVGSPDKTQVVEVPGGRRALWTVGGLDCVNVITGEVVIPAQITLERYKAIKARRHPSWWGDVMGDAKFSDEAAARVLIAPRWLQRHVEAWHKGIEVECFGLDVARSESGDRTVLAAGGAGGCREIHQVQTVNTMEVVGWVITTAKDAYGITLTDRVNPVVVDMDGLGAGVGDRLAELGVWVLEFRGNQTSEADPKIYGNMRAEGYGELSRRLDPDGAWPDTPWGLPNDQELHEELTAPERVYASDGMRFVITPKKKPNAKYKGETIFQQIGRSPDKADAVSYLYTGVRYGLRMKEWQDSQDREFIASGANPGKESTPLTDEELGELPDYLQEILGAYRNEEGWRGEE